MNFDSLDKKAFYSATGVEFTSPQGCKFCAIASRNILTMIHELEVISSAEHGEFIHKLKGIASTCGLIDAARACKKLEEYNDIINPKLLKHILNKLISSMLVTLDN